MHIIKYRCIHDKTSHSDMVKSASTIQNGNFNHALLTLVLRTVSTLEFSGLYVICMRGIKGSSWLVKLFPKSSEIKIREPWPPDTSAVRITCKPESKIHSPSKTRMMEMKNLAHVPSTYLTYFSRVLRADGDTKLWSDERVVNEVGHVLKWLPVVLTGRQNSELNAYQLQRRRHLKQVRLEDLPSIKSGLPEFHQEEGHLKCGQRQDDLPAKKVHGSHIAVTIFWETAPSHFHVVQ